MVIGNLLSVFSLLHVLTLAPMAFGLSTDIMKLLYEYKL